MFKVRSKYLLLIAAAVWLIAGSQVARMGIEAIAAGNGNPWLLLIGIPATFVVFHMMFSKLVGKHAARIRSYGEEKMHVLKFFDVRGVRTVTWTAAYAASPNRLLRLSIVS